MTNANMTLAVGVVSSVAVKQVQPIFAIVMCVVQKSKEWKNEYIQN